MGVDAGAYVTDVAENSPVTFFICSSYRDNAEENIDYQAGKKVHRGKNMGEMGDDLKENVDFQWRILGYDRFKNSYFQHCIRALIQNANVALEISFR